jgi:hypothetical protein
LYGVSGRTGRLLQGRQQRTLSENPQYLLSVPGDAGDDVREIPNYYWTVLPSFNTNSTKHCCASTTTSGQPSDPAKTGITVVDVAASTGDTYPLMYMLACVSTKSAGALRVAEGHSN